MDDTTTDFRELCLAKLESFVQKPAFNQIPLPKGISYHAEKAGLPVRTVESITDIVVGIFEQAMKHEEITPKHFEALSESRKDMKSLLQQAEFTQRHISLLCGFANRMQRLLKEKEDK